MSYHKTMWVEDYTPLTDASMNNIQMEIYNANKNRLFINVQDYGAKGDGIVDDTLAIQAAINASSSPGTLFFPGTNSSYNFTNLVIPSGKSDFKILGAGTVQSWLKSTALVPFSVQTNGFTIDSMRIQGPGIMSVGSILFKDDRVLNTSDFDISMSQSYISETEIVIKTKGHGVTCELCCFYDIHTCIIDAGFPDISVYVPGSTNNATFTTGFRGFIFRQCRVHFSPCMILRNVGANAKNLTGLLISGNQLEGSTGYVEGYVRNGEISNNIHYQCGNVRLALLMLHGCDNLNIELNVSGTKLAVDGFDTYCNEILNCDDVCNGLTVKANIQDVYKDCFNFSGGGKHIKIDVNANNISINNEGDYSLVKLAGSAAIYDGLMVKGVLHSPGKDFIAVKRNGNLVKNYNINLEITGGFLAYDNLDPTQAGTRRSVAGIYGGNGASRQFVSVGFRSSLIEVFSKKYFGMKSGFACVGVPGITIVDTGFMVTGLANINNEIYSYRAQ